MKPFLFLLSLAAAAGWAVSAFAEGPLVELPAYVVTGDRVLPPRESWRYAAAPGFEFLSNLSESETRDRVRDFILFHRVVDAVWPLIRINAQAPATVIFCASTRRFAEFAPADAPKDLGGTVSIALQNHEQAAIIVNLEAAESDAGTGPSMDHYTDQLLRAEYVHFLFSRIEPQPPRWLARGLARLFLNMDYDEKEAHFGGMADPTDFEARRKLAARMKAAPNRPVGDWANDPDFQIGVQHGALIPFAEFFSAAPTEGDTGDASGSAWGRQCFEFVHFCLFGADGRYRKGLATLAVAAMREPVTEEVFRQCFDLSYEDMQILRWAYTDFAGGMEVKIPAPPGGGDPGRVDIRAASDAEVGRIKGDALRLDGRIEEAHLNLIAPYMRGARDPQLLAALGQEEAAAGHDDRARRFLEAAVAAKTTRARAYYELARLRFAAARAASAGPEGKLTAAQWTSVLDLLTAARALRPPLRETYELMAQGWEQAPARPTPEQLDAVLEGARLFPDDLDLVYRCAVLCRAGGFAKAASSLAAFGFSRSVDAAGRGRFAALRDSLAAPAAGK